MKPTTGTAVEAIDHEAWLDPEDRVWHNYCSECERLLGIDNLDGKESREGYSLDSAYSAWLQKITPAEYAAGKRVS